MNFQTYREQRKRTETWIGNADEKLCMLCMGLAGESGEIIDYLKKMLFHKHPFDKEKLIKEMGDMMWYFVGLLDFFKIDIEDVFNKNIKKLQQRYPNGWNAEDSFKRRDEKKGNNLVFNNQDPLKEILFSIKVNEEKFNQIKNSLTYEYVFYPYIKLNLSNIADDWEKKCEEGYYISFHNENNMKEILYCKLLEINIIAKNNELIHSFKIKPEYFLNEKCYKTRDGVGGIDNAG